jgi:hypothetical protein
MIYAWGMMKKLVLIFVGLCLVKDGFTQSSYIRFVDSAEKKIKLYEKPYTAEKVWQTKNSDSTCDWASLKFVYSDEKGNNLIYTDSWYSDTTITEYYFEKRMLIKTNVYFSISDSTFKLSLYFRNDELVKEDLYLNDSLLVNIQANKKIQKAEYYIKRSKEFLRFRPKILDSHYIK